MDTIHKTYGVIEKASSQEHVSDVKVSMATKKFTIYGKSKIQLWSFVHFRSQSGEIVGDVI
jgi:hypothetical protein